MELEDIIGKFKNADAIDLAVASHRRMIAWRTVSAAAYAGYPEMHYEVRPDDCHDSVTYTTAAENPEGRETAPFRVLIPNTGDEADSLYILYSMVEYGTPIEAKVEIAAANAICLHEHLSALLELGSAT